MCDGIRDKTAVIYVLTYSATEQLIINACSWLPLISCNVFLFGCIFVQMLYVPRADTDYRVATLLENLENLEKSGNWKVARENRKSQGKVRENELLQIFSCGEYCSDINMQQVQQSEEQKAAREARKRKSDIESVQQQKKLKMDEAKAITAEIYKKNCWGEVQEMNSVLLLKECITLTVCMLHN